MTPYEKIMRAMEIAEKWEDPNKGATTEELKELRLLASQISDDVAEYIAIRVEEESQ